MTPEQREVDLMGRGWTLRLLRKLDNGTYVYQAIRQTLGKPEHPYLAIRQDGTHKFYKRF